jgi:Zn-finger nucleic acid-binding protein
MRFLVACPACHRQFDATERRVGSTFPCSCGATVTVPQAAAHDAAVVRCSSCGAPRGDGDAGACRFCGAELTLHERDLDTICPGCMARVSGRARFCHFCGTPVLGAQAAAAESSYRCPVCPEERPLASRRLGRAQVAFFDCGSCGGLWLEKEVFEVLADRARSGSLPEGFGGGAPALESPPAEAPAPAGSAAALRYRPCVICGALMNRRNYGRKSGVIVDVCARHGLWFDLHEIDRLLRWIHEGGEERSERFQREAERAEARQRALAEGAPQPWGKSLAGGADSLESLLLSRRQRSGMLFGEIVSGLVDSVRHWFSD